MIDSNSVSPAHTSSMNIGHVLDCLGHAVLPPRNSSFVVSKVMTV